MFENILFIPKGTFLSVQVSKQEMYACWHTLRMIIILIHDFKTMQNMEAVCSSHIHTTWCPQPRRKICKSQPSQ